MTRRDKFDYFAVLNENRPMKINQQAGDPWAAYNYETRIRQWLHRRLRAIGQRQETPEERNAREIKELHKRVFIGPPRPPHVYSN